MKKILIISYFYPPCNLPAAQRVSSWTRYLHKHNYYPVILTRRWDHSIQVQSDISKGTGKTELHEKTDKAEIYHLPYIPSLKDRIYSRYGEKRMKGWRRILSLTELVSQNFTNRTIQFSNILEKARELLGTGEFHALIISGSPFIQFKFGYSLNKEFGIPWIADYRDAWTTSRINLQPKFKLLNRWDSGYERKWVSTAKYITAVSRHLTDAISSYTGVEGRTIYNGFERDEFGDETVAKFDAFTVTYVGTLYPGQQIEIFAEAFRRFVEKNPGKDIRLYCPGLVFDLVQHERMADLLKGLEANWEATMRLPRDEILEIEQRSHLLLYVAWKDFEGIIPSKIYEYIGSGSRILVVPSDDGEVGEIAISAGGLVANTSDEALHLLQTEYSAYLDEVTEKGSNDREKYTREIQAGKLAGILDSIN